MCFNSIPNICQICYDIFLIWTLELWPSIPLCSNVFPCGIPITFFTTTSMPHHVKSGFHFGMHTHKSTPTHMQTSTFNIQPHLYLILLLKEFSWVSNKMVKSTLTWSRWKHTKPPKNSSRKYNFFGINFLGNMWTSHLGFFIFIFLVYLISFRFNLINFLKNSTKIEKLEHMEYICDKKPSKSLKICIYTSKVGLWVFGQFSLWCMILMSIN
jgi:hypothetical protein